jgi:hypothetical protein
MSLNKNEPQYRYVWATIFYCRKHELEHLPEYTSFTKQLEEEVGDKPNDYLFKYSEYPLKSQLISGFMSLYDRVSPDEVELEEYGILISRHFAAWSKFDLLRDDIEGIDDHLDVLSKFRPKNG